ncbi:uncharacterized protein LOC119679109 isoform X2 [Teleopsis dalmanni]|uniref:uncharacterized protein LOC119679109 isoform X2 n=2 Tax=Teleopsis dalmanni TaxID=139649 RepID=UPI0018CF1491|nr:uncharacterized protein LOC119679109 isoform X2 [Teleopsis dalmanni]
MRLDGALVEPHHGAPAIGSSFGVKKYRDKRCNENSHCNITSVVKFGVSRNNNNKYNYNNKSKNKQSNKSNQKNYLLCAQKQQKQQQQQLSVENKITTTPQHIFENVQEHATLSAEIEELNKKHNNNTNNNSSNSNSDSGGDGDGENNKNIEINEIFFDSTNVKNQKSIYDNFHMQQQKQQKRDKQEKQQHSNAFVLSKMAANTDIVADADIDATINFDANAKANAAIRFANLGNNGVAVSGRNMSLSSSSSASSSLLSVAPLIDSIHIVASKIKRVQQSLMPATVSCCKNINFMRRRCLTLLSSSSSSPSSSALPLPFMLSLPLPLRFSTLVWCVLFYTVLLRPNCVRCDDDNFFSVNSFSMGPETTTPKFDFASRGNKKFGDKCERTLECGFPGSTCDQKKKSCQCTEDLPVTNHIDKCGKEAAVNESCFFNEQCEVKYFQTECRDGKCICRFEMTPIWGKDGSVECKGRQEKRGKETYIDPAMIGVLVGMALMFIIICVVLRLFSQARWRENRTIFNTPNPRLMNVSLLRDSKLLHGQERRGSRMSVRAPSRQPSMASLRPHSPNPSLGSRSGSHGSASNASATSIRSTRSNSVAPGNIGNSHHERKDSSHHKHQHHQQQQQQQQQQSLITNITPNPVADSVTVEIIEPEK